jgi:hypothetical protein
MDLNALTVRRAATELRKRALQTTSGTWHHRGDVYVRRDDHGTVAECRTTYDAGYTVALQPSVGLALAAVLDKAADTGDGLDLAVEVAQAVLDAIASGTEGR